MGAARKVASLAKDQCKEQKGGHPESTKRAKDSPLCYTDGHLSSQECGVRTEVSKIQSRVVLRGDIKASVCTGKRAHVSQHAGALLVHTEAF